MHRAIHVFLVLASLVVGLLVLAPPLATAFEANPPFTLIANGGVYPFRAFGNCPGINNAGEVVFTTGLVDGGYALHVGNGVTYREVTRAFHSIQNNPSINDQGDVAFGAYDGTGGVWKAVGTTLTKIYEPATVVDPSINASGFVGFEAYEPVSKRYTVLAGNGTSLVTIAGAGCNFSSCSTPVLNDLGTAVFMGQDWGTERNAIYLGNGGPLQRIMGKYDTLPGGQTVATLDNRPTLNNAGQVVFRVTDSAGTKRLMLYSGGALTQLADSSGPFADFHSEYGSSPAINNSGLVVFHATLDDGRDGLFRGPDPVADKIALAGDMLFGKSIKNVVMGPDGLNDRGDVAFQVLADGAPSMIVRANAVPEPSTVVLVGVAAALLLVFRSRCPGSARQPDGSRGTPH